MIFKTYNQNGQTLLDSQTAVFTLIKAGTLTRVLATPFEQNKREVWYRAKRLGFNSEMRKRLADIHTTEYCMYYMDVANVKSPIVAIHYNGQMTNCSPLAYQSAGQMDNGLRLMFYADRRLSDDELNKYHIYVFDTQLQRETRVGINLYDEKGNITFSNKNPLLNIHQPNLKSNYLNKNILPTFPVPHQIKSDFYEAYLNLHHRLKTLPQDYLTSREWSDELRYHLERLYRKYQYSLNDTVLSHHIPLEQGKYAGVLGCAVSLAIWRNPNYDPALDYNDKNSNAVRIGQFLSAWDGQEKTLKFGLFRELMYDRQNINNVGCMDGLVAYSPFSPSTTGEIQKINTDWLPINIVFDVQNPSYVDVSKMPFPFN